MGLMSGKKGIIFGVSNKRGIGYAIAQKLYDEVRILHLPMLVRL